MTPVKDRIRTAIAATPALTALIGTNPVRCWDRQLNQGSAFPAIVVTAVSERSVDAIVGRMPMKFSRYQFTIWAVNTSAGIQQLADIEAALKTFLETLDLVGIPGLCSYNHQVLNALDGFSPAPSPANSQRIVDALIYANDSL